jgi:hypothetical protein
MKYGRTLTDLAAELTRQNEAKADYIADTRELAVIPGRGEDKRPRLVVNNVGEFPIKDLALEQMGARVGIHATYMAKMKEEAPHLLATNLNHWFGESPERRMVRTLDGENRAFLSDRFKRVDNYDLVQVALPAIMEIPGLTVRSCEVTERRLYVKATFKHLEREIKSARQGDVVRGGLMFGNSEVGHGSIFVTPWAEYLWCTNGAVREGGKRWAHLGRKVELSGDQVKYLSQETIEAGDRFDLLAFRDHVKAALDEQVFGEWIEKVQGTTERKVEGNPVKAVETLVKTVGLTKSEGVDVLRHLIQGGDLSQYGLYNAVTRTAEDAKSYDRATEIETLGQKVIDLTAREWREVAEAA